MSKDTESKAAGGVITLLDGPHRVMPPSANAIIYLEELGYGFIDAFEAVALARDPEALKAALAEAREKGEEGEPVPVAYEVSLKAVRDHITAMLRDSGEDVTPEDVGRQLDVARVNQYAEQILELGSTGPFGSRRVPAS